MRLIVLIKQVPDTYGERQLDLTTGWVDRDGVEPVIDEIDERALEVALAVKDGDKKTEIVVLTMGPAAATSALRKALSMGADSGIHVIDDALAGADALRTADVLAAALRRTEFDVVLAGNESTDGRGGVVPAAVAAHLGLPLVGSVGEVHLAPGEVSGTRRTQHTVLRLRSALPAVVSVTEAVPEARFPTFKGIMTAKRKPVEVITLAELGLGEPVGARSTVLSTVPRPAREAGTRIVDDGTAATQLADFLAANRLI